MPSHTLKIDDCFTAVVGSFGSLTDLLISPLTLVRGSCDVVEIRLDMLSSLGWHPGERPWAHLAGLPLLFTARCRAEGGALELSAPSRQRMIEAVIDEADFVDIELSSLSEMADTVDLCRDQEVPWLASYHRFDQMPSRSELLDRREQARLAGAALFKVAAMVNVEEDIDILEAFQCASIDFPVATMGMGPLAAVSRLRCAMAGSVLNYGFIGTAPTAPGQWPAERLRAAIRTGLEEKS